MTAPDAEAWLRTMLRTGAFVAVNDLHLYAACAGVSLDALDDIAGRLCARENRVGEGGLFWRLRREHERPRAPRVVRRQKSSVPAVAKVRQRTEAWMREFLADGDWHDSADIRRTAFALGLPGSMVNTVRSQICEIEWHGPHSEWRLI